MVFLSEENRCIICHKILQSKEKVKKYSREGKVLSVHQNCLKIFGAIVRDSLQEGVIEEKVLGQPDYSKLPQIRKGIDSGYEAIVKLLEWARRNHPKSGLTPSEVSQIFEDNFRWKITNASARLGELVERNQARRRKDDGTYRYYSI